MSAVAYSSVFSLSLSQLFIDDLHIGMSFTQTKKHITDARLTFWIGFGQRRSLLSPLKECSSHQFILHPAELRALGITTSVIPFGTAPNPDVYHPSNLALRLFLLQIYYITL